MQSILTGSIMLFMICVFSINAFAQNPYFKLTPMNQIKMQGIQRQTLDYSCGAAALSLLLKNYFEDDREEVVILKDITYRLSEEEILDRMVKWFSMLDLKNTAQRLGYIVDGVMLPQEIVTDLKGPVIILLRKNDLNHFVVLKKVTQGRAFIADPARGHLRLPLYELFAQWKGEALILGREGFGLPNQHGLSTPKGGAVAPEREVVRALQRIPPP